LPGIVFVITGVEQGDGSVVHFPNSKNEQQNRPLVQSKYQNLPKKLSKYQLIIYLGKDF